MNPSMDSLTRKRRRRLSSAAAAFLLPVLLLAHWNASGDVRTDPEAPGLLAETLGVWRAESEISLDAEVLAQIEPDAYLMRSYRAPGRVAVWVYAGVYLGRANYVKSAHDPEICYPAQGWEIVHSQSEEIQLSVTESFPATLLHVERGNEREVVIYWFQPARRWPAGGASEQLYQILDAVMGRPEYAFVRLSARVDLGESAGVDLLDLARAAAPGIRQVVEGVREKS